MFSLVEDAIHHLVGNLVAHSCETDSEVECKASQNDRQCEDQDGVGDDGTCQCNLLLETGLNIGCQVQLVHLWLDGSSDLHDTAGRSL